MTFLSRKLFHLPWSYQLSFYICFIFYILIPKSTQNSSHYIHVCQVFIHCPLLEEITVVAFRTVLALPSWALSYSYCHLSILLDRPPEYSFLLSGFGSCFLDPMSSCPLALLPHYGRAPLLMTSLERRVQRR